MEKIIVCKNGGQYVVMVDETEYNLTKVVVEKKTGIRWGVLPKEVVDLINRKLVNVDKVDKDGEVELTYKNPHKSYTHHNGTATGKWTEFVTEEERKELVELKQAFNKRLEEIKANAIARKNDPKRVLNNKIAKKQAEIEALQAEYATMV